MQATSSFMDGQSPISQKRSLTPFTFPSNNNADTYVVSRNQQWSVTALVDASSGSVQERYTYDHFGKRTILEPNGTTVRTSSNYNMPYGYTSRRHDNESGLIYFRARLYDPTTGEFTSRDPLEYVNGMSIMRAYVSLSMVDPFGLECSIDCSTATTGKHVFHDLEAPPYEVGAGATDDIKATVPKNGKGTRTVDEVIGTIDRWITDPENECIEEWRIKAHGNKDLIAIDSDVRPTVINGNGDDTAIDKGTAAFFICEVKKKYCFCDECRILIFACEAGQKPDMLQALANESRCKVSGPKECAIVHAGTLIAPSVDLRDPGEIKIHEKPELDKGHFLEGFNERWRCVDPK